MCGLATEPVIPRAIASTISNATTIKNRLKPGVSVASKTALALILHPTFEQPQLDQRQHERDDEQRDCVDGGFPVVALLEHRPIQRVDEHVRVIAGTALRQQVDLAERAEREDTANDRREE